MVMLIRTRLPDKITLAIGDGSNDVDMISSAHIGIGIMGREGSQAAKVSDYAIGKFYFLRRLLFVHGRECYRRNSLLVMYTFYKNVLLLFPNFLYGFFNLYSAQSLYEIILSNSYNLLLTSMTIILFSIADKQFIYRKLENEPKYYLQGIKGKCFNGPRF